MPGIRPTLIAYNGYASGLGNRVRVVLGAKSLAQLENRDFYYVWPTGSQFGPHFDDLWEFRGKTVSRSVSRVLARPYPYDDESLSWLDDRKRSQRIWQIRTGSPINLPEAAAPWQEELRSLRPVPAVADAVTTFFDAHLRGEPYIGVMIRAHAVSHPKTLETSPVEWFLARMRELRSQDPELRFFVSCDVPEVQRRVIEAIPNSFAQTKKGGYNSTQSVRDAVADLYLLASSGHMLGPHFSSFVHLAEHLSGDNLRLETAVSGSGSVDVASLHKVADPLRPYERG